MSHSRRKVTKHTPPTLPKTTPPLPKHRVGDLLWCRENKKRFSLWWPAMVTYDPHQAIIVRTTSRGVPQVHVQYFGISAVRGWVSHLQYEPLVDSTSHKVPVARIGKKMRCEFEVAVQEATEALRMTHKERKLKFIFNFDPLPAASSSDSGHRVKMEREGEEPEAVMVKQERVEENSTEGLSAEEARKPTRKQSSRRRNSSNCYPPPASLPLRMRDEPPASSQRRCALSCSSTETVDSTVDTGKPQTLLRRSVVSCSNEGAGSSDCRDKPRASSRRRRGLSSSGGEGVVAGSAVKDFVVSVSINGLGTPSGSSPSLLVGQSPTTLEDLFCMPVSTVQNQSVSNNCCSEKPPNGIVLPMETRGRSRPRRNSTRQNFRHAPPLGREGGPVTTGGREEAEVLTGPPPVKRLALDPGSESGSEASGVSIASAILTPPSSGTEAVGDEEVGGAVGRRLGGRRSGGGVRDGPKTNRKQTSAAKSLSSTSVGSLPCSSGVCAICDAQDTGLLACQGHCQQAFHTDCLGLVQPPNFQFICDECQTDFRQCFVCSGSTGELEPCSKPRCGKFYHRSCIRDNNLFVFDSLKSKFTCPLHYCAKCMCNDLGTTYAPRGSSLVQCIKCPLALHRPHCLVAGCQMVSPTHMICYLHIRIASGVNLYKHLNMDTCLECGNSGSLYCCDFCSSAYHRDCMEEHHMPAETVVGEEEKWICPACRDHDLPTYNSVVLCKFGIWRWWPGQIVAMDDVPDNIMKKQPGEGMFVVRFCGSNDYCWIHHGRTLSISLEPGAEPAKEVNKMCRKHGKKRAYTDKIFKRACEEAMQLYLEQVELQEKSKPLPKQESKAYTKIKINRYLVPRPTRSNNDLHSLPCQCTPESPCDDNSICVNRAIHVECDPKTCPVGLFCHNQKMRRCQHADTTPFFTGGRGWGLQAASDIKKGDFVVEYVGEVLDMDMCRERLQRAHESQTQHFYMLTLDSKNGLVIDAKEKSNHARFINHSCDPNCETQKWTVGHESRVGIFAKEDIKAGTELTFDYQLDSLGNEKKECLCGSQNCSGFIGVRSKSEPKPKPKPKRKKKMKPPPPQKPRVIQADLSSVDETHENECFMCGDGGDLLCCDFGKCKKVYHLRCIGRKLVPPERWVCPRHYCSICSKRSFYFCSSCPISYCGKHRRDRFVEVNGKQKCKSSCCSASTSPVGSKEPQDGGVKATKDTATKAALTPERTCKTPCSVSKPPKPTTPPPTAVTPSTPTPQYTPPAPTCFSTFSPPPPPPLPPPPPAAHPAAHPAAISPLHSLPTMNHHALSPIPVLTHPLTHHPLHTLTHPHQPMLFMPPTNHLFYFNSAQPFLASPPSSLIYPSTYHH